ncbi:multiple epidermal growth factor-like domains protein 10 [Haliotis cracherodii]|uniref:multiple epidermal growth factor-like domains protein 10 n=1 Tax=Haliotis cracherodii TaxID=6455 RepID=UPI0039E8EDA3
MKTLSILALGLSLLRLTDTERGCPLGSFGWKCKFRCHCLRGSCDVTNGWCESGCQDGKYGFGCQLDNHCIYDIHGINYTGTFSQAQNGSPCQKWSEPFVHELGYSTESFPLEDNRKNYCRNPRHGNDQYATMPWCFASEHTVKHYVMCADLKLCNCPDGLFGEVCGKFCHCDDANEACAARLGHCKSGCSAGWTGFNCQHKCGVGSYGRGCGQVCGHCHQERCDPEGGACQGACKEGYWGIECTHECPAGSLWRDCAELCGRCQDGDDPCNFKADTCLGGCSQGYTGNACCFHNCTVDRHDTDCVYKCSNCLNGTCGNCSYVCNPGGKDHLSANQILSIGLSVGLPSAAVVVGIVAGLSYKAWRKHTARKCQHEVIEMVPQRHPNAAARSPLSSRGRILKQPPDGRSLNPRGSQATTSQFLSGLFSHTTFQPDLFRGSQDLPRQDSYIDSINIFGTEEVDDNAITQRRHLFGQSSRKQGVSRSKKGGSSFNVTQPDSGFIEQFSSHCQSGKT